MKKCVSGSSPPKGGPRFYSLLILKIENSRKE